MQAICSTCGAPWTEPHECETGLTLKAEREKAHLTRVAVARAWGVSAAYVGRLEVTQPTYDARYRYRAALELAKAHRLLRP
jgi:hypothetical protein